MTGHERTGWRDEAISRRHRDWGFNCPAVDLDFLMVEYNLGLPVALVEYKHCDARMPQFQHATYRALGALADRGEPIPFLVAFYWPGVWAFRVHPVNALAAAHFGPAEELSEREYVERLYSLRSLCVEQHVLARLNTLRPPTVAEVAAAPWRPLASVGPDGRLEFREP